MLRFFPSFFGALWRHGPFFVSAHVDVVVNMTGSRQVVFVSGFISPSLGGSLGSRTSLSRSFIGEHDAMGRWCRVLGVSIEVKRGDTIAVCVL